MRVVGPHAFIVCRFGTIDASPIQFNSMIRAPSCTKISFLYNNNSPSSILSLGDVEAVTLIELTHSRSMWDEAPFDVLSHIFSFLPLHSLARAMTACKHWRDTVTLLNPSSTTRTAPWLLLMPSRSSCCYAFDPILSRWHSLPLHEFLIPHSSVRLVAPVATLLLCRLAASPTLRLLLCNPFTRQFRFLPPLLTPRSNPAVGVVIIDSSSSFRIYIAGGTTTTSSYETTVEVYDSRENEWTCHVEPMPLEFAVRVTVWMPNESSVHAADGVMYWITSARVYSVVGFDVGRGVWREVKVPLADRLEWAALVRRRNGRVGLVGGAGDGEGWVWEYLGMGSDGDDEWVVVGEVKGLWRGIRTKCVGSGDDVYLFRDKLIGSEEIMMVMWSSDDVKKKGRWEWSEWVQQQGSCSQLPVNIPVKGVLFHPTLSPNSSFFSGSNGTN